MKILFAVITSAVILFSCTEKQTDKLPGGVSGINIKPLNSEQAEISARIDTFFQNRFKHGRFNGTVLFAEGPNIIYQNALGYSNFRKKDTLKFDSQFQLASASKPFTALAIMLLENQGKLSFNDSIRHFFQNFPYDNITIHQLLIHRSGLPEYMYFADEYWKEKERDITINNMDVIDLMVEYEPPRYYFPGKKYNYNNTNYCLLAAIIQKASGMTYEEYLQQNIFDKVGMSNTKIYNRENDPENPFPVVGYTGRNRPAENTYLNGVVGDKGIYSTIHDMFLFNRALFEHVLIDSAKFYKYAYQLGHKELHDHDNYGYGWRVNMRPDSTKIVYHNGWWKGFRSYFIRELETQKCIIILTNKSGGGTLKTKELCELFDIKTRFEEEQ